MNNNRYLENLITTNQQVVALTVAPIKVLLGIQIVDLQFDSLLTELLKFAIEKVERRTEVFLSRRDVEISFTNWSGDLQLIGGGLMSSLTVQDLNNTPIAFTMVNAFRVNVISKVIFTVKYQAGQSVLSEDLRQAVLAIVDIKFNVKEIDEQENKISVVLRGLGRYVNASRRL